MSVKLLEFNLDNSQRIYVVAPDNMIIHQNLPFFMKHWPWCTVESLKRDILITSPRQLYPEYRISICGESRKLYLDTSAVAAIRMKCHPV